MEDSLEDILSGNEPEVAEEIETAEEVHATGEEEAATPAADEPETIEQESAEVKAFKTKALDERRKRQEAEARYAELEQRLKNLEQPKEIIDFWDNPEGATQAMLDQRLQALEQGVQARFSELSQSLMRDKYSDYDEMTDYFVNEIAPNNPYLVEQARSQPNPFEFAYKTAKTQRQLNEAGDLDSLKAKLKAEIRAEIESETKSSFEAELKRRSALPETLANTRGASVPTGAEMESLEDILGR